MGLYFHLFYGGIVQKTETLDSQELSRVCKENDWNLIDDNSVYIVNSNSKTVQIEHFACFNTDENNRLVCNYGNSPEHPEWTTIKVDQIVYDSLTNKLKNFNFEPRWIRCEFYSGNMTSSYAIEVGGKVC